MKTAMSTQPKTFMTEAEYLDLDRRSEVHNEYLHGEVFEMAAVSRWHALIETNVISHLHLQLEDGPCEVYTDLRLRVAPAPLYTYPDVMVVCADARFADDQKDTLLNPMLIVEILSPSTQDYDRGGKFEHYRRLPSLVEYLIVEQDAPRVELRARQSEFLWLFTAIEGLDQIVQLASIACALPLAKVYNKITWPPQEPPAQK
jgi:Uma2 family endonuclease